MTSQWNYVWARSGLNSLGMLFVDIKLTSIFVDVVFINKHVHSSGACEMKKYFLIIKQYPSRHQTRFADIAIPPNISNVSHNSTIDITIHNAFLQTGESYGNK